ncbi:hypothetical protein CAL26_10700 [Bordetella genomosp. 9]|uniref:Dienelactone hydrolase domain-containing protein n=1 Tax=Bordetella genomosp. 9 TaxID=1416803 RepID=A0A261RHT2_9BORD|nr:dienelactone hydrolase family protein [Bordetella genomosp. 9]OZI23873.1 hypothetical protein CAL26_10700 [Bordetella genomosp. 9]
MASFIDIPARDGGTFQGWQVEPENWTAGSHGAVIFLAEAYNVNDWARATAQQYADAGFLVLAPDLYWRQAPGTYLEYTPASQQVCRALYARMDFDAAVQDTVSCMEHIRRHPASNGRVGLIGYCLGGKIAFLTAARDTPDAAIGYYSIDLDDYFDETPAIKGAAAFHFGALDQRVPVRYADQMRERKRDGQDLEILVYPKAGHGFARAGQPPYEPESAEQANQHTLALLRRALS